MAATAPHARRGHLTLWPTHSEAYGVRAELARSVIGSVVAARWDGVPEIEFVVLGGGHPEGAVKMTDFQRVEATHASDRSVRFERMST